MSPRILPRDDNCPNGGVFYSCFRGFTGCCLIDACTPGIGCPKDKDLTPNRSSDKITQSSTPSPTQIRASSTPPSSLSNRITTSVPTSTNVAESLVSTITSGSSPLDSKSATATGGPSGIPETSASTPDGAKQGNNSAVIIGAVLGAIILIAVIILAVFCIRKKKRTKVYGAKYPSSEVGSDMSPHLIGYRKPEVAPYIVASDVHRGSVQQLDSKAVVPTVEIGGASPRDSTRFELPVDTSATRLRPV